MKRARLAFAVALGIVACSEATYVYVARQYVPDRDCIRSTVALDIMAGSDPGNCAAHCVSVRARDAGADAGDGGDASADGGADAGEARDLYVTVMCDPLPIGVKSVPDDDERCRKAKAALERNNACLADGGASHPLPPEVDAGVDASVDATVQDANVDANANVDASSDASSDAAAD